jgi:23S rRNA pseudouridine2604 synthase
MNIDAAPQRLSRAVAAAQACSRRDAELLIQGGWVTLDGVVVQEPQERVQPGQVVAVLPHARPEPVVPVTVLFHKPVGLDLARFDPVALLDSVAPLGPVRRRPLLAHVRHQQLVAPLAPQESGMVVWTQEHGVHRRLVQDAGLVEHELQVGVEGVMVDGGLARLQACFSQGIPVRASWQSEQRLRLALRGLKPGQVQALCASVGLVAAHVHRLRVGRLSLGALPMGQCRYLQPFERF